MVHPLVAASVLLASTALAAPAAALWTDSFGDSPDVETQAGWDEATVDLSWFVLDQALLEAAADVSTPEKAADLMARAEATPHAPDSAPSRDDAVPEAETPSIAAARAGPKCTCFQAQAHADADDRKASATTSTAGSETSAAGDAEEGEVEVQSDAAPDAAWQAPMWPVLWPTQDEPSPAGDAPAPVDAPSAAGPPAQEASAPLPSETILTPTPTAPEVAAAVAVAAAAGAGGGWFFGGSGLRHLRHLARRTWWVALYAKLTKDRLLDHRTRQEILSHIESNPGVHINELRHTLGLGHGTAAHHLHALEANGIVVSVRSGRRRCYFPPGAGDRERSAALSSASARRVFGLIEQRPGILQRELAAALGVTPTAVIFQVRRLQASGAVEKARVGREVAYFASRSSARPMV